MLTRCCKLALSAGVALYLTLIVLNNLTDFAANRVFVAHVLAMDTIPADSPLRWRALPGQAAQLLFYGILIAWEAAAAGLGWLGTACLARALHARAADFRRARQWAVAALTLGCLLWLVAFLTVGGEWFLMWQSPTWNGQNAAFRMFTVTALVLLFLNQPEEELP